MTEAGQVILVTGCSSGFGGLIAKTLAAAGHRVFASMRDARGRNTAAAESLEVWAKGESRRLSVIEMDVADDGSVAAGVESMLASAGCVDVVVNNAGVAAGGPIEAFSMDQMRQLFEVNVFGPVRVDKAVLPYMRGQGSGLLVHVTSTLGRVLPMSGGLYPASKWAAEGLAESLRYQVVPFGVEVVILEPGAFPTPAIGKGLAAADREIADAYAARQAPRKPVQPPEDYREPDPQEVADAVLRLIEMPAGERPLRTVVGRIFTAGVEEYNAAYERLRDAMVEHLRRPDQAVTWAGQPREGGGEREVN